MNVLDLFSGIGGFSLGLERAGMRTVAFCEIDPYCRAVLRKNWPTIPIFEDVRKLRKTGRTWRNHFDDPDVICGGFPCQDISDAGKRVGIEGERSGLWAEYARLIGEFRPRYVIVENVAALLGRGIDRVLGDLAALGYDAEWHCIPASAIGAPHRRDRVWIIAHPDQSGQRPGRWNRGRGKSRKAGNDARRMGEDVADAQRRRPQGGNVERPWTPTIIPAAFGRYCGGKEFGAPWWSEPDVGRMAYGLPNQVDRIRALGNAVVPQIPEIIGRAIMSSAMSMTERGSHE